MKKADLLKLAQTYISGLDDERDDEFYGTDAAMAEGVLCKFLQDLQIPTWRIRFVWEVNENRTVNNHRFVLEETADQYLADQLERFKKAPIGSPTSYTKELCK